MKFIIYNFVVFIVFVVAGTTSTTLGDHHRHSKAVIGKKNILAGIGVPKCNFLSLLEWTRCYDIKRFRRGVVDTTCARGSKV